MNKQKFIKILKLLKLSQNKLSSCQLQQYCETKKKLIISWHFVFRSFTHRIFKLLNLKNNTMTSSAIQAIPVVKLVASQLNFILSVSYIAQYSLLSFTSIDIGVTNTPKYEQDKGVIVPSRTEHCEARLELD